MRHFDKNHKNSSSNHNLPQHEKNNGRYPSGPAPGGASTPKSSYLSRLKEKFKRPEEKPATKEEVQQLRLNAQREQARYSIKNYNKKSKELKGGGGWKAMFSSTPTPRGRGGTGSIDNGFFSPNSQNDMFGSGEGALDMFGAGKPQKVRGKQQDEWGGLRDMV